MFLSSPRRWLRRPLFAATLAAAGILAAGATGNPAKAQYYPYYPTGYCNPYYYPYGCPAAAYAYPYYRYPYAYAAPAALAVGLGLGWGWGHRWGGWHGGWHRR
jgi:hypothetical protein